VSRLFIGNLGFRVTKDELRDFVEDVLETRLEDLHLPAGTDLNRNKGFAFIELASGFREETGIELLNGRELAGRRLNVSRAHHRTNERN
jgi:RNA recognition motif-containing protein